MERRDTALLLNDIARYLKQRINSPFTEYDFRYILEKLEKANSNYSYLFEQLIDIHIQETYNKET